MGFWSVRRWMISKAWATIRTAICFLPLFRPFIIKLGERISIVALGKIRHSFALPSQRPRSGP